MARRKGLYNNAMEGGQFLIALISLPFEIVRAINNALDKREMQQAKLRQMRSQERRREVLNINSRSIMRSRETMNLTREKRLELMERDLHLKSAQLDKIMADISLAKAREANILRMLNAEPGGTKNGAVFLYCKDCDYWQNRSLGDDCPHCGHKMSPKHLDVRN